MIVLACHSIDRSFHARKARIHEAQHHLSLSAFPNEIGQHVFQERFDVSQLPCPQLVGDSVLLILRCPLKKMQDHLKLNADFLYFVDDGWIRVHDADRRAILFAPTRLVVILKDGNRTFPVPQSCHPDNPLLEVIDLLVVSIRTCLTLVVGRLCERFQHFVLFSLRTPPTNQPKWWNLSQSRPTTK